MSLDSEQEISELVAILETLQEDEVCNACFL